MRVTMVTDKVGTAIHEPALNEAKILSRHIIDVCDVHPKRPSPEQLDRFYKSASQADVIDYRYWKTASMLRGLYPELKQKKSLLTHQNPYDILNPLAENESYDMVFVNNGTMRKEMEKAGINVKYIPLGIDLDLFEYTGEMVSEPIFHMAVNRIEGKKGVLEVAEACKELGYKLILVGRVSDPNYLQKVLDTGVVDFRCDISWEELRNSYHEAMAHICNSIDNFESGTLPVLEAMASGIPVISRATGHMPDIYDKKKPAFLLNEGTTEVIGKYMKQLVEDRELRCELIKNGLDAVRTFSNKRRAYEYNKYYYRKKFEDYTEPLVSVIIPAYKNLEALGKCLASVEKQDYKNVEIIVVEDDLKGTKTEDLIKELKPYFKKSITYYQTDYSGYGLAMARNIGAINSYGSILLFLDQRFELDGKDFISKIVDLIKSKEVIYPAKIINGTESTKTDFVENVSAMKRSEFFSAGMFCERITEYGGMSQEWRARLRGQGFKFKRISTLIAREICRSPHRVEKQKGIRHMKDLLYICGIR